MFDGSPIVAIATGLASPSHNRKTGPMVQTWILPRDEKPTDAIRSGQDASVCGDCPARGMWCYVNVGQAPNSVWKTYRAGKYPFLSESAFAGKALRLGAWGDPAAVPLDVWVRLAQRARMVTGYTHAWRYCSSAYQELLMASCDTQADAEAAQALGWRTFRVSAPGEPLGAREVSCPASAEAGHKLTCEQCGACNGTATGRRGHIAIEAHGSSARRYIESVAA